MPRKNQSREDRITYEIVVDCYNEQEVAMGWYYYLEDNLEFPFEATITQSANTNTLKKGKAVTVISMADEDDCEHSMWVTIHHEDGDFDIPLEQVEPCAPSSKAKEAIDDWRYWLSQGNTF